MLNRGWSVGQRILALIVQAPPEEPPPEPEPPPPGDPTWFFDGRDDYAQAPDGTTLGLAAYTLSAWIYLDNFAQAKGTSGGSVAAYPIVSKGGSAESNTNYFLGVRASDLRLVAEFEDAGGVKYLTAGTRVLKRHTWYHVAATWDGTNLTVFVNGTQDGTSAPAGDPVISTAVPFAIGTTVRATLAASGRWHGFFRNVRVFDSALLAAAIQTDATTEPTRWGLSGLVFEAQCDDGTGQPASNGVTLVTDGGVNWLPSEPHFQLDEVPTLTLTGPADLGTVNNTVATLAVTLGTDAEGGTNTVEFWGRTNEAEPAWRWVVMPDPQEKVEDAQQGVDTQWIDTCQWIADNKDAHQIAGVIFVGDMTQNGTDPEFVISRQGIDILRAAGLIVVVNKGNHDTDTAELGQLNEDDDDAAGVQWEQYYGTSFWSGRSELLAHYGSDYDNTAVLLESPGGGHQFVIISLEINYESTGRQPLVDWARSIAQAHADKHVIIVSHYLLTNISGAENYPANWGPFGQLLYDGVKDLTNIQLILCGHLNTGSRDDFFEGRRISTRMFDYEAANDMRFIFLTLKPRDNEVFYETYNALTDTYFQTAHQEFTVPFDFGQPAFTKLGEVTGVASGGSTTFDWTGLGANHYEWFARVRTGDVYRDSERRGFDCTGVAPSGLTITSHEDGAVFYPTVAYTLEGTCDLGAAVEVYWAGVKAGDAVVIGTDWSFVWTPDWDDVIVVNGLNGDFLFVADGSSPIAQIDALVYSPILETGVLLWTSAKNTAHYTETAGALTSVVNGISSVSVSTLTGAPGYSATGIDSRPAFTFNGSSAIYGPEAAVGNAQNGVPPAFSCFVVGTVVTPATNSPLFCIARSTTNSNNAVYWGTNTVSGGRWTYARRGAGAAAEQSDSTAYTTGTQIFESQSAGGAGVAVFTRVNGGTELSEALTGTEQPASCDRWGFGARVDSTPDLFTTGALGEVVYASTRLSSAAHTRLRNYLAAEWGVTLP